MYNVDFLYKGYQLSHFFIGVNFNKIVWLVKKSDNQWCDCYILKFIIIGLRV